MGRGFRDPILKVFLGTLDEDVYFVMLVFRLLFRMVFGFESGCPRLEIQHFAKEVFHKSTFTEVGILMIPGCIFYDFGWPWDQF